MAAITGPEPTARSKPAAVGQGRLARWLAPSLFDLIFLSVPAWLFLAGGLGFGSLLLDGDTGWHIRLGEWILDNGRVPRADIFSFTKAGEPWFAWEWLANVILGALMKAGGLKAVLWWSALLIALFAGIVLRHLIWRGVNLFLALPLAMLAVGVSTIHLLARPHLYTLVLLAALLWLVARDLDRPTPWVWMVIPSMALWTNLHGGWAGGVASLAVITAGLTLEALLGRRSRAQVVRYALLTAGALSASVANPYGIALHGHIYHYLRDGWIRDAVHEFQSPSFRGESMLQFEALLLGGLLTAGLLLRRRRFVEALLILFWAHQALGSARHAPLFVIAVLPPLASQLNGLWSHWVRSGRQNSVRRILDSVAQDSVPALRRCSLWLPAGALAILLPAFNHVWPADFPEQRFPVQLAREYRSLLTGGRVFTNDDWADYLLFANYPEQRVFFDGRSDFYGERLGREYLRMMNGSSAWRDLLDRHRIDVALLEPGTGLASLLKVSPDWELIRDTGREVLLVRRNEAKIQAGP